MNIRKLLLAAGVVAMATTSCTSLDDHSDYGYGTKPSISGYGAGTTWSGNEQLGIFMVPAGADLSAATSVNRHYQSDALGNFTAVSDAEEIAFPSNGEKVDFVAYLPYQATADNGTYAVDVTDQTDPAAIDLLYAKDAKDKSGLDSKIRLGFNHQLANVVVAIINDASITSTAGLTVTLAGTPATANFDLSTRQFKNAGPATDLELQVDDSGINYSGIVIPVAPSAAPSVASAVTETPSVTAVALTNGQIKLSLNGQEASVDLADVTLKNGNRVILPILLATDGTNLTATLGKVVEEGWSGEVSTEIEYEFADPEPDEPEELEFFYETMGADKGEKVSANTAINAFTGWDNPDLTFTNVSGGKNLTVRCPNSIGFNSIWFPAGANDFSISGFDITGYTKFVVQYQVACNGTGQDIQTMHVALNGAEGVPESFVFTATNQFSDAEVEIDASSITGAGELHFTTDAANTKGLRLARIRLTGYK
ncbi:MAG: fimbrillin family protein [Alloprevotella sp.]|nr:fimbrillin family protein [Alloprevotella sp.]